MRHKMKFALWFLFICFISNLIAQKNISNLASNLNLSKSNVNRLIYPSNISHLNVRVVNALLSEIEKTNFQSNGDLKSWLHGNLNRFGIREGEINDIHIFSAREYANCDSCKKVCIGRCVQYPGSDCVCINPPSEPNLRVANAESAGDKRYILLLSTVLTSAKALNLIENRISSNLN